MAGPIYDHVQFLKSHSEARTYAWQWQLLWGLGGLAYNFLA